MMHQPAENTAMIIKMTGRSPPPITTAVRRDGPCRNEEKSTSLPRRSIAEMGERVAKCHGADRQHDDTEASEARPSCRWASRAEHADVGPDVRLLLLSQPGRY